MLRSLRRKALLLLGSLTFVAGCGGTGGSVGPIAAATPAGTASATPPATSSGPNVAAVTAALQSAQAYYATMPHQDLNTDLTALAAEMVSSKAFATAVVSYGGITATLPDGTPALIFADHAETLGYGTSTSSSQVRRPASVRRRPANAGAQHEIALLINEQDTGGAFHPSRQEAFGHAFASAYNVTSPGQVDVLDASLDDVLSLSSTRIDFLSIATHGMVACPYRPDLACVGNAYYALLSTTPYNASTALEYALDYAAGNIVAAMTLQYPISGFASPTWAFTPAFLTTHLTFNPGAIVDNQSCYGQSPATIASVLSALQSAGVGRYTGWTKPVLGNDADETEAFIFDRMLGEQDPSDTGLDGYAQQQALPQRPFPLDAIQTVMATEERAGPLGYESYPYATSLLPGDSNAALAPPTADGTTSHWLASDLGGETVPNPPVEYALPSISSMAMTAETATGGTLAISGQFPSTPGTVQIDDASGLTTLYNLTWSKNLITVALPPSGNASAGLVQVFDANGVGSNVEPLTQWQGTLTYVESDAFTILGGYQGIGSGGFTTAFNVTFRSDVHPTVPSIDASPVPQNLYFPQVEGNSTATVTALSGSFTASQGQWTPTPSATLSLNSTQAMAPGALPLTADTFFFGAIAGQPAPCNKGTAGPEGDQGNTFCPLVQFLPNDVASCIGNPPASSPEGICGQNVHAPFNTFSPYGGFGVSSGASETIDPALVSFTMDPASYAITVVSPETTFIRLFGGIAQWDASATVTGTIGPPLEPPSATTPALRARAPAATKGS
jgi:hypothetical protein